MSIKKQLALSASAGSGKTFALTIRYISLLLEGANPSRIVALTFTKKAAAEMQERVYNTLQNLENKNSELKELEKLLGETEAEILQKRDEILPLFMRANVKISTIDSFFGHILRKFSLYLGIMPDFKSGSSNDIKRAEKLFLSSSKKEKTYERLLYLALRLQGGSDLKNIFELLLFVQEKESELGNFSFPRTAYPKDDEVIKIANQIKEYLIVAGASERAINTFKTEDFDVLIAKSFWEKESLNYWDYKKVYADEPDRLFFALKNALKKFYLQKEKYLLGEIFHFYTLYKNVKKELAKKDANFTFDDITAYVYELMNGLDRDFLYFRLDGNIEHLLIDEFQDTNIVQYKILEPIIEEIRSGIGAKGLKSFFYVGDTKQSIYRFRGGMKALFAHLVKTFNMATESLPKNYRSKSNIVKFVNDTFKDKIEGYEPQEFIQEKVGGYVQVKNAADIEEVKNGVQESIEMLLKNGVKAEDIAVLSLKNKTLDDLREHLMLNLPSVRVQTETTQLLINSQSVVTILEFLKYLYFKEELFGRNFQALRGAEFENLPNLQGFDINETPLKITIKCIRDFKLSTDMDTTLFLELAAQYDDIENLLYSYKNIGENSVNTANSGLKLMSIHKSKGLEFEYVIIADMLQKKEDNRNETLLFDYENAKLQNIYINFKNRRYVDDSYKEAREREESLKKEDRLHQLYVACTRAKSGLVIVTKEEKVSMFEALDMRSETIGNIEPQKRTKDTKEEEKAIYEGKFYGAQNATVNADKIEGSLENIYFGSALHFTLEMMNLFDEKNLENALCFAKNSYGRLLGEEAFLSIKRRILSLINNEKFKSLINLGEVFKEQPYMYEGKRKQIDIMVENRHKIVIIDYKSSFYMSEKHAEQVSIYKKEIENISQKRVEAYLCYLRENKSEIINL